MGRGAHPQDSALEFFPLRDNFFFANVRSSFFPETEINCSVFTTAPPFIAWKQQKNASNHWIFLCPPLKWKILSIPIVKSSHSRIFYLDFSWHTSLSIENCWGPLGAPKGPFSAWKRLTKCLKSSNIPLSTSQVR